MNSKRPLSIVCAVFALTILVCVNIFPVYDSSSDWMGAQYSDWEGKNVTLTGKVYRKEYQVKNQTRVLVVYLKSVQLSNNLISYPSQSLGEKNQSTKINTNQINTNQINTNQINTNQITESVICSMKSLEEPVMGQQINVSGKMYPFSSATNPGEFDAASYYQILRIGFRLQESTWWQAQEKGVTTTVWDLLNEKLYQMKSYIALLLENCFDEKDAAIIKTMLLGDKSTLEKETKTLYQASGIIHVMAISGVLNLLIELCTNLKRPVNWAFLGNTS